MKYALSLLLLAFMIASCSEHVPDQHEQLYLDTADSLKLYKEVTYMKKQFQTNEQTRDFTELDFDAFKEKHGMNNAEMKVLADIMQGHVNLARMLNTMNSVE